MATLLFYNGENFIQPRSLINWLQAQRFFYWSITEPSAWRRVTTSRGVSGHFSMASGFSSSPIPGASDIVR